MIGNNKWCGNSLRVVGQPTRYFSPRRNERGNARASADQYARYHDVIRIFFAVSSASFESVL